jgi:DNA-binding IclR family transcriptional regulator
MSKTKADGISPLAGAGKPEGRLAPVRAVERAVALLQAFRPEQPRLSLAELARATGLDKGTTRRLLQTLKTCDLIDHDPRSRRYALSVGVLTLGNAVDKGRELRELSAPILTELSERTGATSFLFVPHHGRAICIQRVRAAVPSFDAAWFEVGGIMPLNCGGAARVILAHLSAAEQDHALALPLPKRTPFSQTDPEALRAAIGRIRAEGHECAIDDFYIGMCGIGVPVFDRAGALVGAVSISSLTSLIAPDRQPLHLDALKRAAHEIGRLVPHMGASGPQQPPSRPDR